MKKYKNLMKKYKNPMKKYKNLMNKYKKSIKSIVRILEKRDEMYRMIQILFLFI